MALGSRNQTCVSLLRDGFVADGNFAIVGNQSRIDPLCTSKQNQFDNGLARYTLYFRKPVVNWLTNFGELIVNDNEAATMDPVARLRSFIIDGGYERGGRLPPNGT
ncbi:hypothetical protein [Paragemmobacter aquarius]|uniref:hypothetical protein n=1 Tax=Paragemmobacter aquarius TaxID=2169400 RepID=UPI001E453FE4|nr:hypothetical protein [Gemmobacter aquarius]